VRDSPGREDEPAGSGADLLVADLEDVLAVEHVEELVFSLMDVERRVHHRWHLLEQAERPAGRLRGSPDQDRHFAEHESLAFVRSKCERRQGVVHGFTVQRR
jgi:hypothetical protein